MTAAVEARPPGRGGGERGSASLLMAGLMGVVVVLVGAALVVAGYAVAQHRARGAADLVAVSAASVFVLGGHACTQAKRSAADNGVRLVECAVVGDQVSYVVSVRVSVTVGLTVRGLPRRVEALAHAGSTP